MSDTINGDDDMIATEDRISAARARQLYGAAAVRGELIRVCAGEWRRVGDHWRFWAEATLEEAIELSRSREREIAEAEKRERDEVMAWIVRWLGPEKPAR